MTNNGPTWDDWVKANKSSITYEDGKINNIYRPHWFYPPNPKYKMANQYDFSGIELNNVTITKAYAETLNFQNSVFTNVNFVDGDFSTAFFDNCKFIDTSFRKSILTNASFNGATFLNCNLNRVNLSGAKFNVKEISETVVYGVSAWDLEISEDSIQSKLIVEPTDQLYSHLINQERIPLMVDNIELAQFIYYLTNHKKIRDTIDILNNKGVLLLGRFKDGGLERLYKLRDWFSRNNYLPMIYDFNRIQSQDYTETIITLSGLSKVVVADLSGDSVPQELYAILNNFIKPVIVYHDNVPYSMLKDLRRKNKYIQEIKFDGTDDNLFNFLPEKMKVAEASFKEIILGLAEEYD